MAVVKESSIQPYSDYLATIPITAGCHLYWLCLILTYLID